MDIEVQLNDALIAQAKEYCGIEDLNRLIHLALTQLVQREAARRLAKLGGCDQNAVNFERERPEPEDMMS